MYLILLIFMVLCDYKSIAAKIDVDVKLKESTKCIRVMGGEKGNIVIYSLRPKDQNEFSKILDDKYSFYERKKFDGFENVNVIYFKGVDKPMIVELKFHNREQYAFPKYTYYIRLTDGWCLTSKIFFNFAYDTMDYYKHDADETLSYPKFLTIDLNNRKSNDAIDVECNKEGDNKWNIKFIPKHGYYILAITVDEELIWKIGEDYKFPSEVKLSISDDTLISLTLNDPKGDKEPETLTCKLYPGLSKDSVSGHDDTDITKKAFVINSIDDDEEDDEEEEDEHGVMEDQYGWTQGINVDEEERKRVREERRKAREEERRKAEEARIELEKAKEEVEEAAEVVSVEGEEHGDVKLRAAEKLRQRAEKALEEAQMKYNDAKKALEDVQRKARITSLEAKHSVEESKSKEEEYNYSVELANNKRNVASMAKQKLEEVQETLKELEKAIVEVVAERKAREEEEKERKRLEAIAKEAASRIDDSFKDNYNLTDSTYGTIDSKDGDYLYPYPTKNIEVYLPLLDESYYINRVDGQTSHTTILITPHRATKVIYCNLVLWESKDKYEHCIIIDIFNKDRGELIILSILNDKTSAILPSYYGCNTNGKCRHLKYKEYNSLWGKNNFSLGIKKTIINYNEVVKVIDVSGDYMDYDGAEEEEARKKAKKAVEDMLMAEEEAKRKEEEDKMREKEERMKAEIALKKRSEDAKVALEEAKRRVIDAAEEAKEAVNDVKRKEELYKEATELIKIKIEAEQLIKEEVEKATSDVEEAYRNLERLKKALEEAIRIVGEEKLRILEEAKRREEEEKRRDLEEAQMKYNDAKKLLEDVQRRLKVASLEAKNSVEEARVKEEEYNYAVELANNKNKVASITKQKLEEAEGVKRKLVESRIEAEKELAAFIEASSRIHEEVVEVEEVVMEKEVEEEVELLYKDVEVDLLSLDSTDYQVDVHEGETTHTTIFISPNRGVRVIYADIILWNSKNSHQYCMMIDMFSKNKGDLITLSILNDRTSEILPSYFGCNRNGKCRHLKYKQYVSLWKANRFSFDFDQIIEYSDVEVPEPDPCEVEENKRKEDERIALEDAKRKEKEEKEEVERKAEENEENVIRTKIDELKVKEEKIDKALEDLNKRVVDASEEAKEAVNESKRKEELYKEATELIKIKIEAEQLAKREVEEAKINVEEAKLKYEAHVKAV